MGFQLKVFLLSRINSVLIHNDGGGRLKRKQLIPIWSPLFVVNFTHWRQKIESGHLSAGFSDCPSFILGRGLDQLVVSPILHFMKSAG